MLLQVISFSLVLGAHEYVGKILSRYNVKKYGSVGTVDFLPWLLLFFFPFTILVRHHFASRLVCLWLMSGSTCRSSQKSPGCARKK